MTLSPELTGLGAQPFVLLRTFRKSGVGVDTPVWVATWDDRLVISTPEGTGKLKRLRRDPRVQLQACSRRGRPVPGAVLVDAVAQVSRDPMVRRHAEAALRGKYRLQWQVAMVVEALVRRGRPHPRPVLLISAAPHP